MITSLSTGSVRFGYKNPSNSIEFIANHFNGLLNGIELCFILKEELIKFELNKKSINFLNLLDFNTLHAPVKNLDYGRNNETKEILKKIQEINKKIDLKHVTFHPNHVSDFSVLTESGFNICIENQPDGETRKGWQFPNEFQTFFKEWKQIGLCFDVNHGMANNVKPIEFTSMLKQKIKYIHLNATANSGNASHNLLVESSKEVVKKIKPVFKLNKPLIIEVNIAKEKIPLIKKEIALIKINQN